MRQTSDTSITLSILIRMLSSKGRPTLVWIMENYECFSGKKEWELDEIWILGRFLHNWLVIDNGGEYRQGNCTARFDFTFEYELPSQAKGSGENWTSYKLFCVLEPKYFDFMEQPAEKCLSKFCRHSIHAKWTLVASLTEAIWPSLNKIPKIWPPHRHPFPKTMQGNWLQDFVGLTSS